MTDAPSLSYLDGPNGRIAFERIDGAGPGVVWLGGFRSDLTGTKASALADWARRRGRAYLRFDYSGHGASDGVFEEGCISEWASDAKAALDALTEGQQVLVGSSMGAWIATLLALARPERVAAAVFIAPAPDFTERLMYPEFDAAMREQLETAGRIALPSEYGEPTIITRRLIEDGRANRVMDGPLKMPWPVRIFQGMADPDVPWRHALAFAESIDGDDVEVHLSKAGDHRLSTPPDLNRLTAALDLLAR